MYQLRYLILFLLVLQLSYIWNAHIDFWIMDRNDSLTSPGGGHVVGCCDNSIEKRGLYTDMQGLGHSRTTTIDTLQSSGLKASEIRTTTLDFGMTGSFALNLLHRGGVDGRGGDKVKVLGIRAC